MPTASCVVERVAALETRARVPRFFVAPLAVRKNVMLPVAGVEEKEAAISPVALISWMTRLVKTSPLVSTRSLTVSLNLQRYFYFHYRLQPNFRLQHSLRQMGGNMKSNIFLMSLNYDLPLT